MKCPKCQASVTATPDAAGFFNCSACGTRLKVPAPKAKPDAAPATLRTKAAAPPPASRPPGPAAPAPRPPGSSPAPDAALAEILSELRELRRMQALILERLGAPGATPASRTAARPEELETVDVEDVGPAAESGADVLLVDDDEATRGAAEAALAAVGLGVRAVAAGNDAIEAIAARPPGVIVLEADLGGAMPGRDLINLIRATMEWVNIPLVLYTRAPIADEQHARTEHGADGFVVKAAGAEALLVNRVREVLHR